MPSGFSWQAVIGILASVIGAVVTLCVVLVGMVWKSERASIKLEMRSIEDEISGMNRVVDDVRKRNHDFANKLTSTESQLFFLNQSNTELRLKFAEMAVSITNIEKFLIRIDGRLQSQEDRRHSDETLPGH